MAQIPSLLRTGFRFRFAFWPIHPEVFRLARLMAPALLTLTVTEVNLLVDNKLASHLGDGGIAALQYGMRLFQLPLGVFAVSVATALLPRFSEASTGGHDARFSSYLADGIALSALVMLPAMVGLLAIGEDVVRLLFEHGSFAAEDTVRTARVLAYYLIGLFPYGLVYLFSRASYALKQTRLPLLGAAAAVAVNVTLDLLLVTRMQEAGLALATGAAGIVNAVLLGIFLLPRLRVPWKTLALVSLGAGMLYAVAWAVRRLVGPWGTPAAVVGPLVGGVAFYAAYVRWTPLRELIARFRGEGGGASER